MTKYILAALLLVTPLVADAHCPDRPHKHTRHRTVAKRVAAKPAPCPEKATVNCPPCPEKVVERRVVVEKVVERQVSIRTNNPRVVKDSPPRFNFGVAMFGVFSDNTNATRVTDSFNVTNRGTSCASYSDTTWTRSYSEHNLRDFHVAPRVWADYYLTDHLRATAKYDWNADDFNKAGDLRLGGSLDFGGSRVNDGTRLSLMAQAVRYGEMGDRQNQPWSFTGGLALEQKLVGNLSALGEGEYDFNNKDVTGRAGLSLSVL